MGERGHLGYLIAHSRAVQALEAEIRAVAGLALPVLISGERGTGKSFVAGLIHQSGTHSREPLLEIDCAEGEEALLEQQVFCASERADGSGGGTLVLRHVDGLSSVQQTRLFDALGRSLGRPSDRRLIATSRTDLMNLVELRRFREDLYYRLNTIHLVVPPLRERREDMPLLIRTWADRCAAGASHLRPQFSHAAMRHLLALDWSGNVRELQDVVSEVCQHASGTVIYPFHLPHRYRAGKMVRRNSA